MTSKPITHGQHPRRCTCPTGLAPRKASQVGFRQLAGSGSTQSPPAPLPSAYVPGLRLAATRTRATKDADSDAGLAIAPLQSWDDSDDGPITGPLQSPGGTSRRPDPLAPLAPSARPGNPTKFSQSDRCGPRARAPVPGRAKYFNSSHSVAIPQRPGDSAHPTSGHIQVDTTRQPKLVHLFLPQLPYNF